MAARVKRTERFGLRLTKSQRARIEEQAEAAGLTMSEFIVRAACGTQSEPVVRATQAERRPDFEARVREEMRTMPRRSAETAVRREEAREKAKAALSG